MELHHRRVEEMNTLRWCCDYLLLWIEGYNFAVDAHFARFRGDTMGYTNALNDSFSCQSKCRLMRYQRKMQNG